uniref:Trichohyalin-plectin-homology domain-containing protein n=1 Tax=Poecilia formosa TaxID=48698 RepID=A0A087YDL3_POEFO
QREKKEAQIQEKERQLEQIAAEERQLKEKMVRKKKQLAGERLELEKEDKSKAKAAKADKLKRYQMKIQTAYDHLMKIGNEEASKFASSEKEMTKVIGLRRIKEKQQEEEKNEKRAAMQKSILEANAEKVREKLEAKQIEKEKSKKRLGDLMEADRLHAAEIEQKKQQKQQDLLEYSNFNSEMAANKRALQMEKRKGEIEEQQRILLDIMPVPVKQYIESEMKKAEEEGLDMPYIKKKMSKTKPARSENAKTQSKVFDHCSDLTHIKLSQAEETRAAQREKKEAQIQEKERQLEQIAAEERQLKEKEMVRKKKQLAGERLELEKEDKREEKRKFIHQNVTKPKLSKTEKEMTKVIGLRRIKEKQQEEEKNEKRAAMQKSILEANAEKVREKLEAKQIEKEKSKKRLAEIEQKKQQKQQDLLEYSNFNSEMAANKRALQMEKRKAPVKQYIESEMKKAEEEGLDMPYIKKKMSKTKPARSENAK